MSELMEGEGQGQPISQKRITDNSADCASPKKTQRFSEPPKTTTDSCMVVRATKSLELPPGVHWKESEKVLSSEEKSESESQYFETTKPSESTKITFESVSESSFSFGGSSADDHQDITDCGFNRQSETSSATDVQSELPPKTGDNNCAELTTTTSSAKPLDISSKTFDSDIPTLPGIISSRTIDDNSNKPKQIKTTICKRKELSSRTSDEGQTILYSIDSTSISKQTIEKGSNTSDVTQTTESTCVASSSNEMKTKEIEENIQSGFHKDKMINVTLDSEVIDLIAKNIGNEWSQIAIQLGFSVVQTDHLREMRKDSLYERNCSMINYWLDAVKTKGISNPRRLLAHCIAEVNKELASKIDSEFEEAEVPKDLGSIIQEIIIGKQQQQRGQQEEPGHTSHLYRGDIQDQFRCTIDSWKDLDQYFYETKACRQAFDVLNSEGTLAIIGPPGEGKSFISHHIALKYMEENSYTIIPVSSVKEIEEHCNPKLKQIFVIDDPLGALCLEKKSLSEWVTKNEKIKSMAQKGLTKFIATIRKSIYNKASPQIKRTIFFKHRVDLTSDQYRLGVEERENILKHHCSHASEDKTGFEKVTGSYFPGFPLLCHLLRVDSKSQAEMGNDLDPSNLMLRQIEEIVEEKENYCALVLTAMWDGAFDPQDLDSLTDEDKEKDSNVKKSKKIIKLCGLTPNEENLDAIKKSFEHLRSIYFVEKECEFYFLHDVIFSVVAYHFGKDHLDFILELCSSTFIQERVRVKDLQTTDSDDGIKPIEIPPKKYLDFAKRLTKDLTEHKHCNVFQNLSIHHTRFQNKWVEHILKTYNKEKLWDIMSFHKELEEEADVLQNLQKTLDFAILSSSPIHWLCKKGMLSMLKQILAIYKNPNEMLDNLPGHTKPLHFASGCGHLDLVKYLFELGQDVNSKSCLKKEEIEQTSVAEYYTGFTPLFYAARENHLEVVEYLLLKGAKPNLVRDHGASPMLLTADRGHAKVVEMLIKYGGDPGLCCDHGTSPLILAASENHVETVKILLDRNVDLNTQKIENGVSAVFFAASRGHYESLKLLLDKKASPNLCNKEGLSPLGVALEGGYLKSAELLINNGAKIEQCDRLNNSALLLTLLWKYSERSKDEDEQNLISNFVDFLLKKGANYNAENLDNESPLSLAESHDDIDLLKLFKR